MSGWGKSCFNGVAPAMQMAAALHGRGLHYLFDARRQYRVDVTLVKTRGSVTVSNSRKPSVSLRFDTLSRSAGAELIGLATERRRANRQGQPR